MKTTRTHDSRTAFRLPKSQREEIERLISEGKFQSLSEVVRSALKQFLSKLKQEI